MYALTAKIESDRPS